MGYFEYLLSKFVRLFLKHGIGAPGPMAKALAKTYLRIKREQPDNTLREHLLTLVYHRKNTSIKLGLLDDLCYMSEFHINDIVDECLTQSSPLYALCVQMVKIEFKEKLDTLTGPQYREYHDMMLDVIKEVVEKYAPGE
tara:strand:+ start:410 stop:826 length:417 start_codon:yes stop_codon:yes gene_type:complete